MNTVKQMFLILGLFSTKGFAGECAPKTLSTSYIKSCVQTGSRTYEPCQDGRIATVKILYSYNALDYYRISELTSSCDVVEREFIQSRPLQTEFIGSVYGVAHGKYSCSAANTKAEEQVEEFVNSQSCD